MKKITILIAMLIATSAWGATTHVYLECNKPNQVIGLKLVPAWLELITILKSGEVYSRQVKTYKGNDVEKGEVFGLNWNDHLFWWKGYSLHRVTLSLRSTVYNSGEKVKQCIIYPREEWKNRKSAYLDGLKKRRKL